MNRLFPLIPAKAGIQVFGFAVVAGETRLLNPTVRASQNHWVPAFAGMSGIEMSEGLIRP